MLHAIILILCYAVADIWMNLWVKSALKRNKTVPRGQVLLSLSQAVVLFVATRIHPAIAVVLLTVLYFLYYANLLHVRYFGNLIGYGQLKQFLSSYQTLKNNKTVLGTGAANLVKRTDVGVFLLWMLSVAASFLADLSFSQQEGLYLVGIGIVLLISTSWTLLSLRKVNAPAFLLFEKMGLLAFYTVTSVPRKPASEGEEQHAEAAFLAEEVRQENERSQQHPLYGKYKGKNLIFIQLESFQEFLVGSKVGGQEITPFLNRLAQQGIYFNNIHSQYAMGHTADVELVSLNSLYPMQHEVVNFTHYDKVYNALPFLLKERGYTSAAFHGNTGEYYNRNAMFKAYGFDQFYAEEQFEVVERIGLGFPDLPFFQQSVEKLTKLPQPFFAHLVTLTSHFPFHIHQRLLPDDPMVSPMLNQYFQSVHYTDRALQAFFEGLEQEGLLKDSVIVLFGDHEGVPVQHVQDLIQFLGLDESKHTYHDFLLRKVPLVVYAGDGCEQYPQQVSTRGSTLDILPTVESLLGLERLDVQLGRDLLVQQDEFVISCVYPEGTFLSDRYIYIADVTGNFSAGTLFERETGHVLPVDEQHESYQLYLRAKREIALSDSLIRDNRIERTVQVEGNDVVPAFELNPELSACLPQMEKDAIILPYTYAFEHIQKESGELIGDQHWQKQIWDRFYDQHGVRLSYLGQLDLEANEQPIYFKDSSFFPFFKRAGYQIDPVQGQTIFDLFDTFVPDSLIVIAVKDEGAQALVPELSGPLAEIGIANFNREHVRFGYLNVILKTANGYQSLYESVADEAIELQVAAGDRLGEYVMPVDLYMKSAGALNGNVAHVTIDGKECAKNQRGMNIVVFSQTEQRVVLSTRVDTFNTLYTEQAVYVARKPEVEAEQSPSEEVAPVLSEEVEPLVSEEVEPVVNEEVEPVVAEAVVTSAPDFSEVLPRIFAENLDRMERLSLLLPTDLLAPAPSTADEQRQRLYAELSRTHKLSVLRFDQLNLEHNHATVYFSDSSYMPFFRQHHYRVGVVEGKTLMQIMAERQPNETILISIKDEGSQVLMSPWRDELATQGITQLTPEHLRWSYVNVIRKVDEQTYESLLEVVEEQRIEVSSETHPALSALPVRVELVSAGSSVGNVSSMVINGQEHSKNHRGMNVVVLDEHGTVTLSTYVDTFTTIYAENTLFEARKPQDAQAYAWTGHRMVTHALGGIDHRAYTNCLEAFLQSYQKGQRVFEVDLIVTEDGHLVARHDWLPYLYDFLMQEAPEGRIGERLTLEEFKALPILKQYTPLDFADLCRLMSTHKDMYLVTDTKSTDAEGAKQEFALLVNTAQAIDPEVLDRIVPQIYREEMLHALREVHHFRSYIYTLYQTHASDEEVLQFAHRNGIGVVAMSEMRYTPQFAAMLKQQGIHSYVHTINDQTLVEKYLSQGVHGFYSDYLTPDDLIKMEYRMDVKREVLLETLQKCWTTVFPDTVVDSLMEQVRAIPEVYKLDAIMIGSYKINDVDELQALIAREINSHA